MKTMNHKKLISLLPIVLFSVILHNQSHAQTMFGGLAEIELRKGQADSSPYLNQTPNDNWVVFTPRIRLFFLADISEQWYFQGAVQADHYYSNNLSAPLVVMANLNWEPDFSDYFTLTAGSFPTPFGSYADRIHQHDNYFIQLPIMYSRSLPVSRTSGLFGEGYLDSYELSLLYRRGYSQGIMFQWQDSQRQAFDIRIAGSVTPVSGYGSHSWYERPSIIVRANFTPAVWLNTGVSFSNGPFMTPDENVRTLLPGTNFENYQQTIVSAYFEISYHYFRFLGEYGWNSWNVLGAGEDNQLIEGPFNANSVFGLAELQYNFSFYPGMYSAIRADWIIPQSLNQTAGNLYGGDPADFWAKDVYRYEVVAGIKLNRQLTLKTSYLLTDNTLLKLSDNVFTVQLAVVF